jgi:hypothetical protein
VIYTDDIVRSFITGGKDGGKNVFTGTTAIPQQAGEAISLNIN